MNNITVIVASFRYACRLFCMVLLFTIMILPNLSACSYWDPADAIQPGSIIEPNIYDWHHIGENIACVIEDAHDHDHLLPSTYDYHDTFNAAGAYTWYAYWNRTPLLPIAACWLDYLGTGATFRLPVTGQDAIPLDVVLLRCVIDDDANNYMGYGGSRDDAPVSVDSSVKVVGTDIDTDSDNDGSSQGTFGGPSYEDSIEETNPGKVVCIGTTAATLLRYGPTSSSFNNCQVTLVASSGSSNIRVWKESSMQNQITVSGSGTTYTIPSNDMPSGTTVYVEGISAGTAMLDLVYKKSDGTEVYRDKVKYTVNRPPTIEIVKPAVDNEYVSGTSTVKAYINDPDGNTVPVHQLYVDDVLKGNMSYVVDGGYYTFDWNTSGTSKGEHTIKVVAGDNYGCSSDLSRPVFAHPVVNLDSISFRDDHTLWNRESDLEITEPQWTSTVTKPFAYTIGSQMTANVQMTSSDITETVDIRYVVGVTWKNSDDTTIGTPYQIDKDTGHGTFPYWLAHYPTAPSYVMDYTLDQSYDFFVRKSSNSDWCPAGEGNATHPQVFLTFGSPVGPWGTSGTPRACWSRVIEFACGWMPETGYVSSQTLDARNTMADKAYKYSNKNYHSYESHFNNDGTHFNMKEFIYDDDWGDCRDMSAWWVKLCNSIGLSGQFRRICNIYNPDYFVYQQIDPVGFPGWSAGSWNFHQVGYYNNVFDACLQLKESDPRVPQNEDINGDYKSDLFDSGDWNLENPLSLTEVN